MAKLIIVGAGGHGRVVLDIVLAQSQWEDIVFVDQNPQLFGQKIKNIPVIGNIEKLPGLKEAGYTDCIIAIGDNQARAQMAEQAKKAGLKFINAIHPSALISVTVRMGVNNVIAAGSIVNTDVQIGSNVIINTGAIVEHDNIIEDNVHISPGARLAGKVQVGRGAHVGIGATVIQNIKIGAEAVIGAGAVVISDVLPRSTVVGVPARQLEKRR
ncbi:MULTISPECIES: acetyltransferase [Carboxydocella]|uniref:Sugar O-acyltransferase, sialic acid O-acetyltransferase NeuD family n=2 Tax=Carboxydocella TaxID=178898 RepID=A0A1T4QX76_9FIRM|nr:MULTISPECIES: acetyltransferase [Carboxydocella]AVX21680.1 sugar O-acyltransferase, sialic acid O-acetyltransferase NeuD family [Carboxydocella thermautotrophica]AVX32091.1 sugar O-acyltransferase, sialic acid O-acetyltransferase NeuD family [Carboxydocella thermautotrophica]GAW31868.1 transferase [Carboxydocella sp. JDF658]SKA07918.1 sugar O-acyltransferase, sialic acid O-acetyltransferase NeuD family [Carboxydocella sporoproducens DSM 16521]